MRFEIVCQGLIFLLNIFQTKVSDENLTLPMLRYSRNNLTIEDWFNRSVHCSSFGRNENLIVSRRAYLSNQFSVFSFSIFLKSLMLSVTSISLFFSAVAPIIKSNSSCKGVLFLRSFTFNSAYLSRFLSGKKIITWIMRVNNWSFNNLNLATFRYYISKYFIITILK